MPEVFSMTDAGVATAISDLEFSDRILFGASTAARGKSSAMIE